MKIAYVSRFETIDVKNWSGTEYFIAKAISAEQENSIEVIAGLKEKIDIYTRLKYQINLKLGRKYHLNRSPYIVKQYARQVEEKLKHISPDIIFSPGTIPIAHLKCEQPKVFYTDATFASMVGYYDWYKGLSPLTVKEGLKLDQAALDTSALAIYASDWAAESAVRDYGVPKEKVKVVPLGANIRNVPGFEDIKTAINRRRSNKCKVIFIGVDWERKGGYKVLETVRLLNEGGMDTELHIVGLDNLPLDVKTAPFVVSHGFISKSTPEGLKKFESALAGSHFLFMPSQAEAYGLVYCEASAYGIPSIATKTGGITTIIRDNENGMTFPIDSPAAVYADYIQNTFTNKELYRELALSSYNRYKTRLNWDVAGKTIVNYMRELL